MVPDKLDELMAEAQGYCMQVMRRQRHDVQGQAASSYLRSELEIAFATASARIVLQQDSILRDLPASSPV
jgi:hypothetical protein